MNCIIESLLFLVKVESGVLVLMCEFYDMKVFVVLIVEDVMVFVEDWGVCLKVECSELGMVCFD